VIDRKLNVAMTRAREQMLLLGNRQLLSRNAVFRKLIEQTV
jgi:superfamily I DNA and/or RNA helicase